MYCVLRRLSPPSKGFLFKDILAGIQVNFCIIPPGSIFCNCFTDWPEDWVLRMAGGGRKRGRQEGREGVLPLGTQHLYSETVHLGDKIEATNDFLQLMVGEGASLLLWGMEGRVPGSIAPWLRLFTSQPSAGLHLIFLLPPLSFILESQLCQDFSLP